MTKGIAKEKLNPPCSRNTTGRHDEGKSMIAWLKELDGRERKTLIATVGGWATDSVDVMVFTYVVPTLITVWGMSKIEAGWITTATVISSAIGGWLAGVLADRFGRVRILQPVSYTHLTLPTILRV